MLGQRIATALVLLPLLLGLVWFASPAVFYGVMSVIAAGIAWEWAGLMHWRAWPGRTLLSLVTVAALIGAWWSPLGSGPLLTGLLAVVCLWWALVPLWFKGFPTNLQNRPIPQPLMAVLGILLIVATILALVYLRGLERGPIKLLYVLFLVFAADTGAFFAGRRFGRHKLAPTISPGKTIEGALGGLALCVLWACSAGIYAFAPQGALAVISLVSLSVVVALASIVGDLTESMFKRLAGIKDSGTLLPGHGGLLDRVDSLLSALPVMALGLMVLAL